MTDPRSMKARKARADARKDIMSKPAIRNALQAAAKKNNTSVGKSAVDNFVNTYKNTKVGPIQRAISSFFKPSKPNRKEQANRATSQGGRSRKQAIEANQTRLAGKSKAGGGKAVLSQMPQKAADKIAAKDANMNIKKPTLKTWRDYSSIAAAKAGGSLYYSKGGKKTAAVTQTDLKKSGLSLRDYLNYKTGKTRKKGKK